MHSAKHYESLKKVTLLLMWMLICSEFSSRSTLVLSQAERSDAPIRLVLQTSKKQYRSSETIRITAYLENVSDDKFFYIGRDIYGLFGSNTLHYIELSFKDEQGKDAPIGRGAGHGFWEPGITVREKLERAYVLLGLGMIYGVKEEVGLPFLKPGRYHLQARYHEFWAKKSQMLIRLSLAT